MAGNVKELTDATFDTTVNDSGMPVLVDFWAPWCGPCKMISPLIEQIATEYAGKAVVAKVNIDEHREAAMQHGVTQIPTFVLFKDGQVAKKWIGGQTRKTDFTGAIDELL